MLLLSGNYIEYIYIYIVYCIDINGVYIYTHNLPPFITTICIYKYIYIYIKPLDLGCTTAQSTEGILSVQTTRDPNGRRHDGYLIILIKIMFNIYLMFMMVIDNDHVSIIDRSSTNHLSIISPCV